MKSKKRLKTADEHVSCELRNGEPDGGELCKVSDVVDCFTYCTEGIRSFKKKNKERRSEHLHFKRAKHLDFIDSYAVERLHDKYIIHYKLKHKPF